MKKTIFEFAKELQEMVLEGTSESNIIQILEDYFNPTKFSEIIYGEKKVDIINSFTHEHVEKLKKIFGVEKTIEQVYDDFFETADIYNNIKTRLQG